MATINLAGGGFSLVTPIEEGGFTPSWSLDSGQIAFLSYQDSDFADAREVEEWRRGGEVYLMNYFGGDVRRLTNNEAFDGGPVWAPRKRGVEVSAASVIISDSSNVAEMPSREVTAKVRPAVVRVETNLGSGSGFVIESGGLILTNNHVIRDAEEIEVTLDDGRQYSAKVQGRDLVRDLALLKIEATGLLALGLGDLGQIASGSEVLVAGFP